MARPERRPQSRRRPKGQVSATAQCPSGKAPYTSFEAAAAALARLNGDADGGNVYRCRACGFRHITRSSRAEYDRRQAEASAA